MQIPDVGTFTNTGALVALSGKGHQDRWMEDHHRELYFDARSQLIGNRRHHMTYAKLSTTSKWKKDNILEVNILPSCDLINEVDVVIDIPNDECTCLNDMLERIDVHYGGFRIDTLNTGDIHTHLQMNCDIWKRKITFHGNKVVFPLLMAPFYTTNLVFPSTPFHSLTIDLTFTPAYLQHLSTLSTKSNVVSMFANMYYVEPSHRDTLYRSAHDIVTFQNQHTGKETVNEGVNSFPLRFNHPMYLMYFWGVDVDKIRNVKVVLDKEVYYDGPVAPLIHKQRQRGIDNRNVVTVFFSPDDVGNPSMSIVNFSRIDNPRLVIETDQEEPTALYIVGINMQPMKYINGLVGLVYAK